MFALQRYPSQGPNCIRKELPLSSAFPAVKVRQTDSLEDAYKRVLLAFTEKGIQTEPVPPDPQWKDVARLFSAIHENASYLCVVNTRAFTLDEEYAFLSRTGELCSTLGEQRAVYFRGYSPVYYSDAMRYLLSNASRFAFVLTCNNLAYKGVPYLISRSMQVLQEPEDAIRIGHVTLKLCGPFVQGLPPETAIPKLIEHVVVNVLRTEKDPDKENTGFAPCGALDGLGCALGNALIARINSEKNLTASWVVVSQELLVKIFAKISPNEQFDLMHCNPCGKIYKLFDNGMDDSVVSLVNSAVALARHQLTEKGLA